VSAMKKKRSSKTRARRSVWNATDIAQATPIVDPLRTPPFAGSPPPEHRKPRDMAQTRKQLDHVLRAVARARDAITTLNALLEQFPELAPHVSAAWDALLRVLMALESERDDVAAEK